MPTKKKPPAKVWHGSAHLEALLVDLDDLVPAGEPAGDLESVKRALEREGQVRPVLLEPDGETISERVHLYLAALDLGWTHIAAKPAALEDDSVVDGQGGLFDDVVASASAEERKKLLETIGRKTEEADDAVLEEINSKSKEAESAWVGLPKFVQHLEPAKVVVSCDSEEARDALLDCLGIATVHKGTRGTISVWWPDREKKDLASLRFEEAR